MKVRLEDQRIVFRLNDKDRDSLLINKSINSTIVFETGRLTFTIELTQDFNSLKMKTKDGNTTVLMPESFIGKWDDVKVGFEEELEDSNAKKLFLIIEKDLKRSKRRDRSVS